MSKTRNTGFLTNVINVDTYGNVNIVSGSTTLLSVSSSGAVTTTGTISGSNVESASLALNSNLLQGTGSVGFATTGSFTTVSGSFQQVSGSYVALSSSFNVASSSFSSRTTQIENVYATTGSNSFRATQSITGSLTVTGQIIAQTLNVQQVTSSIVYSSGSNVFGCDINSRQTFTGSFYQTGSVASFSTCVGIGTTTPSTLLHLVSSGTPTIRITNNSGGAGAGSIQYYSGSTQVWNLGTHTSNDFYIYNNNTGTYAMWMCTANNITTFRNTIYTCGDLISFTDLRLYRTDAAPAMILGSYNYFRLVDQTSGNSVNVGAGGSGLFSIGGSQYICTTTALNTSLSNPVLTAEQRYVDMGGGEYHGGAIALAMNSAGGDTWLGGVITAALGTTTCTGGYPGGLGFWVKAANGTKGCSGVFQAMKLDYAGRLGIGTATPSSILAIQSAVVSDVLTPEQQVTITNTCSGNYATLAFRTVDSDGNHGRAGITVSKDAGSVTGNLNFIVRKDSGNFLNAMKITSDGYIGIGTSSPNVSGGLSGNAVLTMKATTNSRVATIELVGCRDSDQDNSSYIMAFSNSCTTPFASIRFNRGATNGCGYITMNTTGADRFTICPNGSIRMGTGLTGGNTNTAGGSIFTSSGGWSTMLCCTFTISRAGMTGGGGDNIVGTIFVNLSPKDTLPYPQPAAAGAASVTKTYGSGMNVVQLPCAAYGTTFTITSDGPGDICVITCRPMYLSWTFIGGF